MRVRIAVFLVPLALALAALIVPGTASAYFVHTVAPGESLTEIAAADGLSVSQLAAANGLPSTAWIYAGSGIQIPPQAGPVPVSGDQVVGDGDDDSDDVGAAETPALAAPSSGSYVVQPGDTLSAIAAREGMTVDELAAANGLDPDGPLLAGSVLRFSGSGGSAGSEGSAASSPPAAQASGSYVVQPGDTLTAIAAREGMTVDQLAADNGLYLNAPLLIGTVLRFSGSGSSSAQGPAAAPESTGSAATSQPVGAAAEGSSVNPPYPTPQSLSPTEVGSIAAQNDVPPALADAIAEQESGFNNAAVSPADARGEMQILPGTWDWINQALVPGESPLSPDSATDNVRGGVLLLHSLLNATGGNAALAAAGYYQGLPSVEQNGMYADTQQYVNNVLALEQRFDGG